MSKSKLIRSKITDVEQIIKEKYIGDRFTLNPVTNFTYAIKLENNDRYIVNKQLNDNDIGKEICLYQRYLDDNENAAVVSKNNIKTIRFYENTSFFMIATLGFLCFLICCTFIFLSDKATTFDIYFVVSLCFLLWGLAFSSHKSEVKKLLNEEELASLESMAELNASFFEDEALNKDFNIKEKAIMPEMLKL